MLAFFFFFLFFLLRVLSPRRLHTPRLICVFLFHLIHLTDDGREIDGALELRVDHEAQEEQ